MIGSDVQIAGELTGTANVDFAGVLEGSLVVDGFVVVRPEGRIIGRLEAAAAVVLGRVEGQIRAVGKVELGAGCKVEAEVDAGSVAIADGAAFDGAITMHGSSTEPSAVSFTEKRTGGG